MLSVRKRNKIFWHKPAISKRVKKENMCYNLQESFQPFQQFVYAIPWVEGNKRLLCCGKQRNIHSSAVTDVSESIFWQCDFTHHISTLNLLQWLILMLLFPSSPSPLYLWVGILFTIEEYNKYGIDFSVSNTNFCSLTYASNIYLVIVLALVKVEMW